MVRLPHFSLLLLVLAFQVPASAAELSIVSVGAVGDGTTLNTRTIQLAIDSVSKQGGGMVVVPAGTFLTGTLTLRSHVEIHLTAGAVLKGSGRLEDYVWNGRRVGLLFTQDVMDVSITGPGTIDGNGDSFMILDRAKGIENAGTLYTRQKDGFRKTGGGIGDGPAVPKDRPFQMIIFSDCKRVTIRDVYITNSPFWTLHFADCDGVIVSGLRIWCNLLVPNNDGVDFTSCSNVQMSDCDIRTGDDCIAITGYDHHFDLPGYKNLKHDSENITITNCTLQSRSAAIRIGGFDQNSMRNYTFNNIIITNSNRGIGIFVRDAGSIENLIFSNMVIDTRLHTGDWWGNGEPIHLSAVRLLKDISPGKLRNVKFQNVLCRGEAGMIVYGSEESVIEGVSFDNVSFHVKASVLNELTGGNIDLRPALDPKLQLFSHDIPAFYACHVRNLDIRDVDISWDDVRQPFFTHGVEVEQFEGLTINGLRATGAPKNVSAFPIALRNGTNAALKIGGMRVSRKNVR